MPKEPVRKTYKPGTTVFVRPLRSGAVEVVIREPVEKKEIQPSLTAQRGKQPDGEE